MDIVQPVQLALFLGGLLNLVVVPAEVLRQVVWNLQNLGDVGVGGVLL